MADAPPPSATYRVVHECRSCGNENASETKQDYGDDLPVACGECGAQDWERTERDPIR